MPFQLTIAQGQDSGKSFSFEQPSITIGRTDECDVVLYDSGVSRQHARIFAEGPSFFVEDMGSANGTRVNGATITKQQLAEGDSVALGAVTFTFSAKVPASPPDTGGGSAENPNTRIVSKDEIKKKRVQLVSENVNPESLGMGRKSTTAMSLNEVDEALARSKSVAQAAGRLSAVERARIRRESPGLVGSLRIFWLDANDRTRMGVGGGGVALLVGLIVLTYYFALAGPATVVSKLPPEPTSLSRTVIHQSFGWGDGVDYKRRDSKVFDFDFNAATRALIILHYQSRDISDGEVDVTVNGKVVGKLAPDTVENRANELLIPPLLVKRGERNVISFSNIRNPKASETWRIWDLWLEVSLLPDMPAAQLLQEARDAYQRGQVAYDRREVGAESRYMAWRDFREAWLKLEAHPDPKPELYQLSREQMRVAQQELDATCKKLLLEAMAYNQQHNWRAARQTLDHVHDYFPANDQPCPRLAEQRREEFGL